MTTGVVRALLALSLVAWSCGHGMRVQAERNPAVDLTRYATYAWAAPSASREGRLGWSSTDIAPDRREWELMGWRVQSAVDGELRRRHYVQVTAEPALLVAWRVVTRSKDLDDKLGEYARYRAEGGTESWGQTWVGGYQEGSLIVEIRDAGTRQLLWHGSATAIVNPELREQRLPEAVRRMFADFPARPDGATAR